MKILIISDAAHFELAGYVNKQKKILPSSVPSETFTW